MIMQHFYTYLFSPHVHIYHAYSVGRRRMSLVSERDLREGGDPTLDCDMMGLDIRVETCLETQVLWCDRSVIL